MTLAELRARARLLLDDSAQPYLWSNAEIDYNINEALRQACVRGRLLRREDTVSVVAEQAVYELPDYFDPWQVIRVWLSSQSDIELTKRSRPELVREYCTYDLGDGTPIHYRLDGRNGDGPFFIELSPTPDAADTLNIEYIAVPCPLTTDTARPEIPLYYHEKLMSGVLMLCYQKRDADTFDTHAAQRHAEEFTRHFGPDYSALELNHIQTQQHYAVIPE